MRLREACELDSWHYLSGYSGWQGCDEISVVYWLRGGIHDLVSLPEPELCVEWASQ